MPKYPLLRQALLEDGVLRPEELVPAEPAPLAALVRVHTSRWVEAVVDGRLSEP